MFTQTFQTSFSQVAIMKESFAKKETSTCVYFVAFKLSFNEELDEHH